MLAELRARQTVPDRYDHPVAYLGDHEGNLYVAEWSIGGRFSSLLKD